MTIELVETSEESSFLLVADHIAALLNDGHAKTALAETPGSTFLEQCSNLIADGNYEAFLSKVQEQLDLVYAKSSDKECECISNILVHAVARVPDTAMVAATKALAAALSSKVDERAEERLNALLNLYGVTNRSEVQLPVLLVAAEFAQKQQRLANLLTAVVKGRADQWVTQWGLPEAQARQLYLTLAALVKTSQDKAAPKEYLRLVIAALKLGQEGDAAALAQLKPHAVAAVAEYTRNPVFFQSDLGELPAVRQLASDSQHAPLYKLMTSMLSGDINLYREAATPQALELAGMSADAALHKARMAALLNLGNKAGHEEVSFSAIQRALDISEEQVELILVRAIGSKLLEGKIDQVRGCVSITRCTMRAFGPNEWKSIKGRLINWRESLVAVQQSLVANKAGAASAGVPNRGQQAIKV